MNSLPPRRIPIPTETELGGQHGHRYSVIDRLGGGTTSQVFRALDNERHRIVVLKFLLLETTHAEFEHWKAYTIRDVGLPPLVRIFDIGEWQEQSWEPPTPYIVMEYLEGESLEAVL